MTITSGIHTVGSGGDYANFNLAFADIDPGGLTAFLTFLQTSDVTDTAPIDTSGAPIPLNGNILSIGSNISHFGDFNLGHLWARDNNPYIIECTGAGLFNFIDVRVDGTGGQLAFVASPGSTLLLHIHDILMEKGSTDTGNITIEADGGGCEVFNNIIAGMQSTVSGELMTLIFNDPDAPIRIFNNVVETSGVLQIGYAISPDGQLFTDLNINNNIAIVNGGAGWDYQFGPSPSLLAGMISNATTDEASLIGTLDPVQGFDPAIEFVTTIFADPNYLQPTGTSQFRLAGSNVNLDTNTDMAHIPYGIQAPIGGFVAAAIEVLSVPLFFRIIQHLWPISHAFDLTDQDKQFTEFNQALTVIGGEVKTFADDVYGDLFPQTTRELDAWETQWNLPFNSALSEQERRDRIANAWSSLGGQSPRYIQDTIQGAGFTNVFLHEWWELPAGSPPVARNPNVILQNNDDLLVNIITFTVKDFITGLDEAIMECGETPAQLGQYTQFIFSEVEYEIPSDPELFPYFLYFGDETFPNRTTVPADREAEFKQLLLKICPAQQWLGLLIDYV